MIQNSICEVWNFNLEKEILNISELIDIYPIISFDTEYPGKIIKINSNDIEEILYNEFFLNINYTKIIQIGITLGDLKGNLPKPINTWQFNFKFNLNSDIYNSKSIELLKSCNIDFNKLNIDGINYFEFGYYLISSGLIMNNSITFITYHSLYDFGYLLKIISCLPISENNLEFLNLLKKFIPNFYDLKFISNELKIDHFGGLQGLANDLNIFRQGTQHNAGSDSLITYLTFIKFMEKFLDGNLNWPKYLNQYYKFYRRD